MSIHRALIRLATLLVPKARRPIRREEWLSDLEQAREYGIPARQISLGALWTALIAPTPNPKGSIMLPIGPLATGIHLSKNQRGIFLALVAVLGALLLGGLRLLLL